MLRECVVILLTIVCAISVVTVFVGQLGEELTEQVVQAADATGQEPAEPEERYAIVGGGDTLWAIASREYPGEHTGKKIHEIRTMNPGIDPGRLQIGQRVMLP